MSTSLSLCVCVLNRPKYRGVQDYERVVQVVRRDAKYMMLRYVFKLRQVLFTLLSILHNNRTAVEPSMHAPRAERQKSSESSSFV